MSRPAPDTNHITISKDEYSRLLAAQDPGNITIKKEFYDGLVADQDTLGKLGSLDLVVSDPGNITIKKEFYDGLVADQDTLAALEAGGVDNWDGYHESLESAGLLEEEDD